MPANRTRKSKRRAGPCVVSQPTRKRSNVKGRSKHTNVNKSARALPETQMSAPSSPRPPPAPSAPVFKVHPCPNKGQSSYAMTNILPGTRIVDEPPLFSVHENPRAEEIEIQLDNLSPAVRTQFRALSSGARSSTDYSRFITNSIQMDGTEQGLFLQTSRFNHSCVPNTYFGFDPKSGHVRIHALLPIDEGEEITINYGYGAPFKDREQRNRALRSYGFECDCRACNPQTSRDHAIESRRQRMGVLQGKIDRNKSDHPARVAELGRDLRTLAGLLERAASEGDLIYTALADTYHSLTLWHHSESVEAYCGDNFQKERFCLERAVEIAERKLQLDTLATGDDSTEAAKAAAMLDGERKSLARLG